MAFAKTHMDLLEAFLEEGTYDADTNEDLFLLAAAALEGCHDHLATCDRIDRRYVHLDENSIKVYLDHGSKTYSITITTE